MIKIIRVMHGTPWRPTDGSEATSWEPLYFLDVGDGNLVRITEIQEIWHADPRPGMHEGWRQALPPEKKII